MREFPKSKATTVTTALTNVLDVLMRDGENTLILEVAVTTQNLDQFKILLKANPDGSFQDYLSGTDFDVGSASMLFCSTEGPHELTAATAICLLAIRTRGAYAVRIQAAAAVTGAIVTIRGTTSRGA